MAATHADEKPRLSDDLAKVEEAEVTRVGPPRTYTPIEIQARFDTLRDLSPEQMEALNKKVVSKIDWRLMPMITIMFLLK